MADNIILTLMIAAPAVVTKWLNAAELCFQYNRVCKDVIGINN